MRGNSRMKFASSKLARPHRELSIGTPREDVELTTAELGENIHAALNLAFRCQAR